MQYSENIFRKISTSIMQHRSVNIVGKLVEAISNSTDCINVPEITYNHAACFLSAYIITFLCMILLDPGVVLLYLPVLSLNYKLTIVL